MTSPLVAPTFKKPKFPIMHTLLMVLAIIIGIAALYYFFFFVRDRFSVPQTPEERVEEVEVTGPSIEDRLSEIDDEVASSTPEMIEERNEMLNSAPVGALGPSTEERIAALQ